MKQYIDLFILRKQFTHQMAAVSFMSYVMSIAHRYPHKINISFETGNIWATELLPCNLLNFVILINFKLFRYSILNFFFIFYFY